jgi:hypothetical protein
LSGRHDGRTLLSGDGPTQQEDTAETDSRIS